MKNLLTFIILCAFVITSKGQAPLDTFLVKTSFKHRLVDYKFSPDKVALKQETLNKQKQIIREIAYDTVSGDLLYIENFFYEKNRLVLTEQNNLEDELISYTNYTYNDNKITLIESFTPGDKSPFKRTKISYKGDNILTKQYEDGKLTQKKTEYYVNDQITKINIIYKSHEKLKETTELFNYDDNNRLQQTELIITKKSGESSTTFREYSYENNNSSNPKFITTLGKDKSFIQKELHIYYTNGLLKSKTTLDDKNNYINHYSYELTTKPLYQQDIIPKTK